MEKDIKNIFGGGQGQGSKIHEWDCVERKRKYKNDNNYT